MPMTRDQIAETIDAIDTAIMDAIATGVGSFSVSGGSSYTNIPIDKLNDMRGHYAQMLFRMDHSRDGTSVRVFPRWQTPFGGR